MTQEDPFLEPERGRQPEAPRTPGGRIGVSISAPSPPALLDLIAEAEAAGVAQLWMTQNPVSPDTLTIFAAALGRTSRVRLGTSIVPTYPRHPLALAQQAATVAALGPGRLRLGVGPSHRPTIEGTYGITMDAPLAHLREYYDWAFMLPHGAPLRERWAQIPAGTDVLVTHGPPYGQGDLTFRGEHAGCEELAAAVRLLRPELNAEAVTVARRLQKAEPRAACWVGSDALRELTSEKVAQRVARR